MEVSRLNEIEEYKLALRNVQNYQRKLCQKRDAFQPAADEESILTGIIDSLTYSIQYLETGREPGIKRGVYRRSQKQREVLMDPNGYQFINIPEVRKAKETRVSDTDKERLNNMLSILTQREREVLMLVRGQGISFEKVARLLNIKKASTQTLVKRAELKIQHRKMKYDLIS